MDAWAAERNRRMQQKLGGTLSAVPGHRGLTVSGQLRRVVGLTLEAAGVSAQLGGRCRVQAADGHDIEAEVVGFSGDRIFLMPTGDMHGVLPHARVTPLRRSAEVEVGSALLGRILDGEGYPLDGQPKPRCERRVKLMGSALNPLMRHPIDQPLDVGVRAINALLTVGRGQRIGLFAGSGVGKSTLLGMMTRFTAADVIVVGLIGERGREVRDFVQNILGAEGMRRAVVIATPADRPPLMRLRGAWLATAIAEHFRDEGRHVLLLMDSLTRFAQAQREIGLAVGEPPTTRGYPPSVFARLPQLVERAGNADRSDGSITAFYTVLTEGDDPNDPISDAARAILDGHFVLSRSIAESGLYPSLDIERSVSRLAHEITDPAQQALVRDFRQLFAAYQGNRDLINIGAYQRGSDPRVDRAILMWPKLQDFLRQGVREPADYAGSVTSLRTLLAG
ncbi:MAG: flagellar protein export ATPase FliI [Gammaproteobacteria bacterium]|nr:flagellar protein export ATPase FliI [Gammaproteobacteria bacterium]